MIQSKTNATDWKNLGGITLATFKTAAYSPDMKFVTKKKTEPRVRVTVTNAAKPRNSKGFTIYGTTVNDFVNQVRKFIESSEEPVRVSDRRP